MGAMVAAVSKKNEDTIPKVIVMLKELMHRGDDAHGVATPSLAITAESIEELTAENIRSSTALGHNLRRIFSRDRPQPVRGEGFTLVFEGRLFPSPLTAEVDGVMETLKPDLQRNAGHIIERLNGAYTFAITYPDKVIAGRDTMGTYPLYYGENGTTCAVASERKALWAIGIKDVNSFPPGNLAMIDVHGFSFKQIKTISQPPLESMEIEAAAKRLQDLLLKSVRERVSDVKEVAVAFSGGLDSSVIASLAKANGVDVHLVSVGLENQSETRYAEVAAKALGLPLHVQTYGLDEVKVALSKVLWLIEEPNVMKVSIAIPLYWVAETASKLGYHVLLSGQGGDELFGGYQRYLREYTQSGAAAVENAMYRDVALSYETNLQRDNHVCSFHKMDLRLPFVDCDVAHFALSLPLGLKIESVKDHLRKRILRRVAQNLGLPIPIANKTKKAIQYATGVYRALQKLARKEGLTPGEYVEGAFRGVYPMWVINDKNSHPQHPQ